MKPVIDCRPVRGEFIRDHLGATPAQRPRIVPGYANPGEHLANGGRSTADGVDGATIAGELGIV